MKASKEHTIRLFRIPFSSQKKKYDFQFENHLLLVWVKSSLQMCALLEQLEILSVKDHCEIIFSFASAAEFHQEAKIWHLVCNAKKKWFSKFGIRSNIGHPHKMADGHLLSHRRLTALYILKCLRLEISSDY